jgi:ferritin
MKQALIENAELVGLLQQQITNELNNSRLYLAISQWFDFNGYFNLAKLYKNHSDEERDHQDKIINLLQDRNIMPKLGVAEIQPNEFLGVQDILDKTLARERKTTSEWNNIYFKALMVKDGIVATSATWFVDEQRSEENESIRNLDKFMVCMMGDNGCELFDTWVGEQLG